MIIKKGNKRKKKQVVMKILEVQIPLVHPLHPRVNESMFLI